jgi:phosphatidylethanolamine/phosphatidyl-N-methylethanolamine N-methyltransferase
MRRWLSDNALFLREFFRNFHTTGAILPSGRRLAAALARFVEESDDPVAFPGNNASRRILEVGPGTGAVTRRIIAVMRPADCLDLVELNESFVRQLEGRFASDPEFQPVANRARVLHCPIEELPRGQRYDRIVSGLPLNNFAADDVERILAVLVELLASGGVLSFFEYIAVRRARSLVSGRLERTRLRGIDRAMRAVLDVGEFRRDTVLQNVPPAWVHHVRRVALEPKAQ